MNGKIECIDMLGLRYCRHIAFGKHCINYMINNRMTNSSIKCSATLVYGINLGRMNKQTRDYMMHSKSNVSRVMKGERMKTLPPFNETHDQ